MSAGLQALRAVIEANALDTFRSLSRVLFLDTEAGAFDHVQRFVERHDQLPSIEALAEDGIRLPPTTGPMERHIERLRQRAGYNAVASRYQALTNAAGCQDVGAMEAMLREMLAAIEATRGSVQVVPSTEAAQRIAEKYGIMTFAQLRDEEIEPTAAVVHNLIGEGASLLCADPKAGKTTMLQQVAVAVATGRDAFGGLPVRQGPVLTCRWRTVSRSSRPSWTGSGWHGPPMPRWSTAGRAWTRAAWRSWRPISRCAGTAW
jgi:hypothetical protein